MGWTTSFINISYGPPLFLKEKIASGGLSPLEYEDKNARVGSQESVPIFFFHTFQVIIIEIFQ